ncbi:MAG TPA: hypothetical protein PKY82_06945 [Pyrinomonadaceae bacterium]|nr:hypothetical protein [Pyrinomonadaceae bacterium]
MPNNIENKPNTNLNSNQKETSPKVEIREHITRQDVRAEPDKIFLFGDNLAQMGFGGQAKEMRGEANSIGIPTKKAPSNDPKSFFTDHEFDANKKAIDEAFQKIPPDKIIVIPKTGFGTGLAQLPLKAPNTFVYLNQKLAELGFHHQDKEFKESLTNDGNKVLVQNSHATSPTAKRLLDLNNIQNASLKTLSPNKEEIDALKIDPNLALTDYAERLRQDYKTNRDNFRDGMRILSASFEKGEQITITCSCRNGSLCHADVVKMAVEKVSSRIRNTSVSKVNEVARNESLSEVREQTKAKQISHQQYLNPRTQKAINEIFSFTENDRVLEKINQTDGRNRSEQASYLGKSSQFIRDIYEHGGQIKDGYLILPQENINDSPVLTITTEAYAVDRINQILRNETKAKELAPVVVDYANKIAGVTADGETKLKVFGWIYDSLEGKSVLLVPENSEKPNFAETLEKISILAEELHSLEPIDKTEFVSLVEVEKSYSSESLSLSNGENLNLGEIYEEAISPQNSEQSIESEIEERINPEGYDRISLNHDIPRVPAEFTPPEIFQLIDETLPKIDSQLENGISQKEILAPFNEAVWNSAKIDIQAKLENIYQKQYQSALPVQENNSETSRNLEQQLSKINLLRQNIIEIKHPAEYLQAEKEAVTTFYRQQKQEIGQLLTKIDELRQTPTNEKNEEPVLKKQLKQIKEAKPNFAFKLENSNEIVFGIHSQETVEKRNFVSSYINYQLEKPETRLRYENERYRFYAARLESAFTRDEIMKTSAEIRAENAVLGRTWKDLTGKEKESLLRPLTNREMQFLFTELSPAHYTSEMTAIRLSYAHSGGSRRQMTESLLKGEINPSPEAQKLIKSLEGRLQRSDLNDSLLATKHFFESIKTPNESLKYKNKFDHQEIYQKLPPQEKDFVYQRAIQQKENLQYQLVFNKGQLRETAEITVADKSFTQISETEKDFHLNSLFHQAGILGERIDSAPLTHTEIKSTNVSAVAVLLNNQPLEKLEQLAVSFQKSQDPEKQKIAEVINIFADAEISKDENKTTVSIKLPENHLIGTETYHQLLAKFYPDNLQENNKYKFENFNEKEVNHAREKGQDAALKDFHDEINNKVYQNSASAHLIENETAIIEILGQIAHLQMEGRHARQENELLTLKYTYRTSDQLQKQKNEVPTITNQKIIVSAALGLISDNLGSNKIDNQFLKTVQKEITITDFEKFTANEKLLSEMKVNIRNEFAEMSESLKSLEENKVQVTKNNNIAQKEQIILSSSLNQGRAENKPLSLGIFEKEFKKAENQLIRHELQEKLSGDIDPEKNLDPKTVFSNDEHVSIKSAAVELVKEKLEPKELNVDNRKISPEASRQAFATYKQLEKASQLWQTGDDKSKITEAFFKLDGEASKLNEIRQEYHRNEKMELLREGIKTDLIDLLKKNPTKQPNNFEAEINNIVLNNLNKTDFIKLGEEGKQVSILSRQIAEKIEAKQIFSNKEKSSFGDSREMFISAKTPYSLNSDDIKTNQLEKTRDAPIFTR